MTSISSMWKRVSWKNKGEVPRIDTKVPNARGGSISSPPASPAGSSISPSTTVDAKTARAHTDTMTPPDSPRKFGAGECESESENERKSESECESESEVAKSNSNINIKYPSTAIDAQTGTPKVFPRKVEKNHRLLVEGEDDMKKSESEVYAWEIDENENHIEDVELMNTSSENGSRRGSGGRIARRMSFWKGSDAGHGKARSKSMGDLCKNAEEGRGKRRFTLPRLPNLRRAPTPTPAPAPAPAVEMGVEVESESERVERLKREREQRRAERLVNYPNAEFDDHKEEFRDQGNVFSDFMGELICSDQRAKAEAEARAKAKASSGSIFSWRGDKKSL
ncbi:hypothetical protein NHQ30_009059 [Ciborinia camelliae]|nr:hypothetical protein NHQ30_009059 [Ciborinia camelliae]